MEEEVEEEKEELEARWDVFFPSLLWLPGTQSRARETSELWLPDEVDLLGQARSPGGGLRLLVAQKKVCFVGLR